MRPSPAQRPLIVLVAALLCLGAASAHAQSWIATGSYNGNGNDGRAITGVGFQPDVVFISAEKKTATYCRTATMGPGLSKSLGKNDAIALDRIVSLDSDGFTINGTDEVNGTSEKYYWVAMRTEPGVLQLGTYVGSAPADQTVGGLTDSPVGLVVMGEGDDLALLRTDLMAPFFCSPLRGENPLNDAVTAFTPDGFDLGAGDAGNRSGVTFHYIAWYDAPGFVARNAYLGDKTTPRLITGLGLDPAWVMVRSDGNQDGLHRNAELAGDETQFFQDRDNTDQGILGIVTDGFAVGDRNEVNDNGVTYNWLAFADPPTASDLEISCSVVDASPDVGDTVAITVSAANIGTIDASLITVNAPVPAGLAFVTAVPSIGTYDEGTGDWDFSDLTSGAVGSLTVSFVVMAGQGGELIEFTAGLTASTPLDDRSSNDLGIVELTVPDVDIVLAAVTNDSLAVEGAVVVLGVTTTNNGRDVATGLEIEIDRDPRLELQFTSPSVGSFDAPTDIWSVGDLAPGTTANLVLAARVAAGSAGDTLTTVASVSGLDQEDSDTSNNVGSVEVRVLTETESADLVLVMVPGDPTPEVGSSLGQTITLVNAGPGDATGVLVAVDLPPELGLTAATPSLGTYDGMGSWTVGPLPSGGSATLALTTDVLPAAGGRTLATAATATGDQFDPDGSNNAGAATIDVPLPAGSPYLEIVPISGGRVTIVPGSQIRPVLYVQVVNHGAEPDTVRQLTVTNLSTGAGTPSQFVLDAEWAPLSLLAWSTIVSSDVTDRRNVAFANGRAVFSGLEMILAPGDTCAAIFSSAPSLAARDGAVLRAGLAAPEDCVARQPVQFTGGTPVMSGHDLVAECSVAAQFDLREVPAGLLAVGSERNLVLDLGLPANGYLSDWLYGLSLVNHGTAEAGTDIVKMEAWADGGDRTFPSADDVLLGDLIHSGDRWQLTGLHERVAPVGKRVFVSVDIAESAQPARTTRLGLPIEYGPAVEMDSGNDGPLDRTLENTAFQSISVTDRVIVTADVIPSGVVHPGERDVSLLSAVLNNTYETGLVLESLTVTNTTTGVGPATTAELDGVLQQLVLRLDGDDDGELDEPAIDPALGSGAFKDSTATFPGLDLDLPAGAALRVFVTGDVSLTAAAEGNRPSLVVTGESDFGIRNANTVAAWPLDSEASLVVDGLVAEQVVTGPVPVRALAPSDTLALAFDLTVPPNGYKNDELVGLTLVNRGTADQNDLARVRLWADAGNDVFDPWTGDDQPLGDMTWNGSTWSSPVLGRPVGQDGLRLFVTVDVAAAPADSSTVRLALPQGGLILDSQNSGPLDQEILAGATLVLSTSPLSSTIVFDTPASTVGQTGTIRMTVRNLGTEALTGVVPDPLIIQGTAGIAVGSPQPSTLDLAVDEEAAFTWSFTATGPGDVFVTASAAGAGAAQTFRSAPTPSPNHQVYGPALQLDCYPTTSLPASVNKGQTGLAPITLTLANPGADTVADVALTGLRLRLTDHAGGAGIVPDDLVDAIAVFEGTNVYAALDTLPTSGAEIDLVFADPAVITHREPVTLGVRLDLNLNTTATSFVVSIEDATFMTAVDGVNGTTVPVVLADGDFPLRTGEAHLTAPAGIMAVAMAAGPDHSASPGQADVPLATFDVTNAAGDASSSAINLLSLAFVLRDGAGNTVTLPRGVLGDVEVHSAYQQHFVGPFTILADSVVLVEFTTPAVIPADATVPLELFADLLPDATPQTLVPVLADPDLILGEDANTGDPVPVDPAATVPGPRLEILNPPDSATADGRGLLPPDVSVGAENLQILELTLGHPGSAATAAIDVDRLTLLIRDGAGVSLDPAVVFDRLILTVGAVVHADLVDPTAPDGRLVAPLTGLALDPGTTATLTCAADLAAGFTGGSFQIVLALDGIALSDAVSGAPVAVTPAASVWPLGSGVTSVRMPAEELAVSGFSLMSPLLVPGPDAYPVLELILRNTAAPGGGSIELQGLFVDQSAPGSGALSLGAAVGTLQVLQNGEIIGAVTGLAAGATGATVDLVPALQIPADSAIEIQVAFLVTDDPPSGSICLRVGEDGPVAALPGAAPGGIRIVPASGQSLPIVSLEGNIGKAGLSDSYANFPNPFAAGREETTFAFALDRDGEITLRMLTPHGEPVATILDHEPRPAGFHQSDTWNGVNGRGVTVRNGVYIAEIVVDYDDGSRERHLRKVAVVR